MAYFGWHVSSSGSFKKMAETAYKGGADTFAFFPRSPRGGKLKALDTEDILDMVSFLKEHKFGPLVAHAPYIYNLASKDDTIRKRSLDSMKEDIERLGYIAAEHPVYYNFHPGAHTGQGTHIGINKIADALNEIIDPAQNTILLLETMAGKGSEIGSNFDELAQIIDCVDVSDKVAVCLDTCHTNDAGLTVADNFSQVLDDFDAAIGLEKLLAFHINDSKNEKGSRKDRHETIGRGTLGLSAFKKIVSEKRVKSLPFILETPNELPGYAFEIDLLRQLESGLSLKDAEKILDEYWKDAE